MEQKHIMLKLVPFFAPNMDGTGYQIVLAEDAKAGDSLPAGTIGEDQLPFRGSVAIVETRVAVSIPAELRK